MNFWFWSQNVERGEVPFTPSLSACRFPCPTYSHDIIYVAQAFTRLWDSLASVSQGLELQICSTQLGSGSPFLKHKFEHWMLSPFSPGCLTYKSHFPVKYIELSSNVSILAHIWSTKHMQCRSQAVSLECVHWYYVRAFTGITDTINLEASLSKLSSWMCITSDTTSEPHKKQANSNKSVTLELVTGKLLNMGTVCLCLKQDIHSDTKKKEWHF